MPRTYSEDTPDSNPPIRVDPKGRISSTWQTIGVIIAFTAVGTFAWAAMRNQQINLATDIAAIKLRQDSLEFRITEQHDILIRMGMNVDYLANGRRGPAPQPTVTPP